jgi:hypothetical protein
MLEAPLTHGSFSFLKNNNKAMALAAYALLIT